MNSPRLLNGRVLWRRFAAYCGRQRMRWMSTQDVFKHIFERNHWKSAESKSGLGSTLDATVRIRGWLPPLLERLQVQSLLDVPCGDFNWMQHVALPGIRYIGGDIVEEIIDANRDRFSGPGREFVQVDLLRGPLPPADAVLCRDCLVHLCLRDAMRAIAVLRASPAQVLLATTYPQCGSNRDIVTGSWRKLNLELPPFNLPPPLELLQEEDMDGGKFIGAWRLRSTNI